MDFREKFAQALLDCGKSRAEISRDTGISQPLLLQYMTGKCEPKHDNAIALAKSLGVPSDYFWEDDDEELISGVRPNVFEIHVNNAVLTSKALNEWSALKALGIFKEIGEMVDFVRTNEPQERNYAWIYQVELNGQITLAYVKRVR